MELYSLLLDDLDYKEKSVFLYCFILSIPQKEASKRLKIPQEKISTICCQIQQQQQLLAIRDEIQEAFGI